MPFATAGPCFRQAPSTPSRAAEPRRFFWLFSSPLDGSYSHCLLRRPNRGGDGKLVVRPLVIRHGNARLHLKVLVPFFVFVAGNPYDEGDLLIVTHTKEQFFVGVAAVLARDFLILGRRGRRGRGNDDVQDAESAGSQTGCLDETH